MERRLLRVDEVAIIAGLTNCRVYTMLREGILPGVKLGRQVRVDSVALSNFIENGGKALPGSEIKILSASLGNLLPLAQSINSSLQNDSFPDKKMPSTAGRRGYENGSHSEIEVSKEPVLLL